MTLAGWGGWSITGSCSGSIRAAACHHFTWTTHSPTLQALQEALQRCLFIIIIIYFSSSSLLLEGRLFSQHKSAFSQAPPEVLIWCTSGGGGAHLEGSGGDGGVQTTTPSIDLSCFCNGLEVIFSLPAVIKLIGYFWGKHCVKGDYWKSVPQ